MGCLKPIQLRSRVQDIDNRWVDIVPCGKCPSCLARRQQSWAFRLGEEMKQSETARFVSLTYDEEHLPMKYGKPSLNKRDLQLFFKRLRKNSGKKGIKYYACGEYGTDTQRPHYHAIIFNMPDIYILNPWEIEKDWQNGHIKSDPCNMATITYTTKYLMKGSWEATVDQETGEIDERVPEFSIMSKGMGKNYLTEARTKHLKKKMRNFLVVEGGRKVALPRYYKEKVFDEDQRAIMSEEALKFSIDQESKFKDEQHRQSWVKDQYRKAEKKIKERNKL